MKRIPNKIYLQVGLSFSESDEFDPEGATWCQDRIDKTDVPYYRMWCGCNTCPLHPCPVGYKVGDEEVACDRATGPIKIR